MGRGIVSDALDRAQKERDLVLREQAGAREASEYEAKVAKRNEIEALKAGLRNPNADNYALNGTGSGAGINMPAQPTDTPQGDAEVTPTNYGLGSPAGGLGLRAPRSARAATGVDATETPTPAATGLRGGSQLPASGATFKPRKSLADEQDVLAQIALANNDIAGFNAARAAQRAYRIDDINAEVAKMTPEEIEAQSGQLNLPGTQIPVLSLGKTKGGYEYATTDPVTGQVGQRFVVSEAQRRQMVAAKRMADAGFGTESMSLLEKVDKNLAEHVSKWNQTLTSVAQSRNEAQAYDADADYKGRKLTIDEREAAAKVEYYKAAASGVGGGRSSKASPEAQVAEMERVLGRPLTEAERLKALGLSRSAQLDEREKIAYPKALDALAELPEDATAAQKADVYRKFGLDPEAFGLPGIKTWGPAANPQGVLTREGQKLLGLTDAFAPKSAPAGAWGVVGRPTQTPAMTSQDVIRNMYRQPGQ